MGNFTKATIVRLLVLPVLSAIVGIFAVSCTPPEDPALSVKPSVSEMKFSADGKTVTAGGNEMTPGFTVETNQGKWEATLSEKDSWLKVSETSSGFTLSADENTTADDRGPITVTVKAGKANPVTIKVTQGAQVASLLVTPSLTALKFSADGEKAFNGDNEISPVFAVQTDHSSWDAVAAPAGSWLKLEKSASGFALSADENTSAAERGPVTVTVTAGNAVPVTIKVTQEFTAIPKNHAVYISGMAVTENDDWVPALWRDGQLEILGGEDIILTDIALSGKDIYLSGLREYDLSEPLYWHGGTFTTLPVTGIQAAAFGVAVSGADVYVAGVELMNFTEEEIDMAPVYWKNGTRYELPMSGHQGEEVYVKGVTVSGGDVYIGGFVLDFDGEVIGYFPAYWKNGELNRMGTGYEDMSVVGMAVEGNDVYIAGDYYEDNKKISGYWKNNIFVPLSTPGYSTMIFSIEVSDGDVYVAGVSANGNSERAVYWKNGAMTVLDSRGAAFDVAVYEETVYILGSKYNVEGGGETVCYWIDGKERVDVGHFLGDPWDNLDFPMKIAVGAK